MNAQRISVIKKFVALLTVMHIALCSFSQSTRGNQILSSDDFFGSFVNRSWTASDGLPANTITSIMQDRNDYMYMGTYSGLVRFDGIDFLTINSSLDSKYRFVSARSVFEDSRGNIWCGSNDEGVACLKPDGVVSMFTMDTGLPNNSIRSITEDRDGNIWIGTASGVAYITKDEDVVTPKGLEAYNNGSIIVVDLFCDTAGRIWCMTPKGGELFCYSEGMFSKFSGITKIKDPIVSSVTQDSTGAFWFGVSPHYAVKIAGTEESVYDVGHGKQKGTIVNCIYQDRNSNIWFALDNGVAVMHEGLLYFYDSSLGLTDNNVNVIMEDREGNIWLGTDRGGIEELSVSKFRTIPVETAINAIAEDKKRGVVWLGGDTGLFCYNSATMRFEENEFTEFCDHIRIRHVAIARNGDVLVSSYEKFGQIRMGDSGIRYWTTDDGLAGMKVRLAVEVSNGDLYVGTTAGLSIIDAGTGVVHSYTTKDGLPHDYIMCITEAKDGSVWCGTDGGGIFVLEDRKVVKTYNSEDGLVGNVIFKINEIKPGEMWMCTGTGVSRFKDDDFFSFNSANGLGTDSIFQIIPDYTGSVWMTSNKGVSSVKLSELEDVADGKKESVTAKFFGRSDGLRSGGVTSTSLSMKDELGRVWFTLIDGFAIYDPVKVTNKTVPVVRLQYISVDNEEFAWNGQSIVIPPSGKRLSIKYTGITFVSSEQMLFRYKLEGFDTDYSQWSTSRSVSYTNLKHGLYKFSVQAMNADDIQSEFSETLVVVKQPYLWELWWFRTLIACFVVGLVVLVIAMRFRRMKLYQIQLESDVKKATAEIEEQRHNLELANITLESQKEKLEEANQELEYRHLELERKQAELASSNMELAKANKKANDLLLNILPRGIARELSENPGKLIAKQYPNVAVLFADIVGFTKMSSGLSAPQIIRILNTLFYKFDTRLEFEGVEKIKTIGDAYMAACGLTEDADNGCAKQMIELARGMLEDINAFNLKYNVHLKMRIGINCGKLVAGVIGKTKFIYDIWGDAVNVASRMESSGQPGKIHVTDAVYEATKNDFSFSEPVEMEIKGKGAMKTYFLV